jgi:hypothetical protein
MTLAQEKQNIVSDFPLPLVVEEPCLKRSGTHREVVSPAERSSQLEQTHRREQ